MRVDRAHFVQLDDVQPRRRCAAWPLVFSSPAAAAGAWHRRRCRLGGRPPGVAPTVSSSPGLFFLLGDEGVELLARA